MTRINSDLPPSELSRQHLLAELREIKRIPNAVKSGRAKLNDIPKTFRLGAGHCKYFYNKLGFLLKRYKLLRQEALDRGYNVQDFSSAWDGIPNNLMGEYEGTEHDREIVRKRIIEKNNTVNRGIKENINE